MQEREFVDALIKTIRERFPGSSTLRANDNYTLGIPDVLAWIPNCSVDLSVRSVPGVCWAIAIEAKALHPLMPDPFHRGRRIGKMLKHPFSGPQISTLRMLVRSGVEAFGLVRASADTAFRIHPDKLPADTGNFTYDEMIEVGEVVKRQSGQWRFWREGEADGEISGAGHRNDPGDRAPS